MRYSIGRTGFLGGMSVTNKLIILNLILFFPLLLIASRNSGLVALTPSLILQGQSLWTFITSMFAHRGFFHIFANMFSLFFIGNFLERIIGSRRFILMYLAAGLTGGIFFVLSGLIFNNDIPGVGASGALFGLLGVLAMLVPYSKIYLIAGPLIVIFAEVITQQFVPSSVFDSISFIFTITIFLMIFAIFSWNPRFRKFAVPVELPMWLLPIVAIVPLVIIDFIPGIPNLPIGNSAHIGGLFAGLIYGFYLRQKFPNKIKKISKHFR